MDVEVEMINVLRMEKIRGNKGITKYALAKRLRMSRQSYYDILKRGSTTWKTLEKIARVLDCKPKDLLQ